MQVELIGQKGFMGYDWNVMYLYIVMYLLLNMMIIPLLTLRSRIAGGGQISGGVRNFCKI